MSEGGEVRLGRDGDRTGWTYVVLIAGAVGGICAWAVLAGAWSLLPSTVGIFCSVLLALVISLTRLRGDELVLGPDGVVAHARGRTHRWPWSEVLELGMVRANTASIYVSPGCTVLIRVEGRAFDTPGPNMPFAINIPAFGRRAHGRVRTTLEQVCRDRGIPFDARGLRMARTPRPDSPLRPDRAPKARARGPTDVGDA